MDADERERRRLSQHVHELEERVLELAERDEIRWNDLSVLLARCEELAAQRGDRWMITMLTTCRRRVEEPPTQPHMI